MSASQSAASGVVLDGPEGERLHARLGIGTKTANGVRLHPVEYAWLVATGRLEGAAARTATPLGTLLASQPGLEVAYLAYADLRERGLPVRPAGPRIDLLEVRPRGGAGQAEPEYVVECHAERAAVAWATLHAAAVARRVGAVVDDDGQITFYRLSLDEPRGHTPMGDLVAATGTVLHDRVLVEGAAAAAYRSAEALGTLRDGRLLLSFVEAEHLRARGVLDVPPALAAVARGRQPGFDAALAVYGDLRQRQVVAKSGLKFGTHLRGYKGDPDASHADWLIQCGGGDEPMRWSDLSRGVRLAHGVRKAYLAAGQGDGKMAYVRLGWFRP